MKVTIQLKNGALTNSLTEIFVEENAFLDYYKVQNDNTSNSLIDNTYIHQEKIVRQAAMLLLSNITRNNLSFYQNGKGINSILNGVTILNENSLQITIH